MDFVPASFKYLCALQQEGSSLEQSSLSLHGVGWGPRLPGVPSHWSLMQMSTWEKEHPWWGSSVTVQVLLKTCEQGPLTFSAWWPALRPAWLAPLRLALLRSPWFGSTHVSSQHREVSVGNLREGLRRVEVVRQKTASCEAFFLGYLRGHPLPLPDRGLASVENCRVRLPFPDSEV